jgi:hypothetical protein
MYNNLLSFLLGKELLFIILYLYPVVSRNGLAIVVFLHKRYLYCCMDIKDNKKSLPYTVSFFKRIARAVKFLCFVLVAVWIHPD